VNIFREKIEMALREFSGTRRKMIHEETKSKKSRDTVPLINNPVAECHLFHILPCLVFGWVNSCYKKEKTQTTAYLQII
jgi:hypothetical protein